MCDGFTLVELRRYRAAAEVWKKTERKKRRHPFLSEKINSQPVCEQAFLPLRSDRSFVDRRFSAIDLYPVGSSGVPACSGVPSIKEAAALRFLPC